MYKKTGLSKAEFKVQRFPYTTWIALLGKFEFKPNKADNILGILGMNKRFSLTTTSGSQKNRRRIGYNKANFLFLPFCETE
jgi:hypothetical protein